MRMVGKPCAWLDREVIEHQEGAEIAQLGSSNRSPDSGARSLGLLNRQEGLPDRTWNAHVCRRDLCLLFEICWWLCWSPSRARRAVTVTEIVEQDRSRFEDVLFKHKYRYDANNDRQQNRKSLHEGRQDLFKYYIGGCRIMRERVLPGRKTKKIPSPFCAMLLLSRALSSTSSPRLSKPHVSIGDAVCMIRP